VNQVNYQINEKLSYPVYTGTDLWNVIRETLSPSVQQNDLYILTDRNTRKFCYPILLSNIPGFGRLPVFTLPAGEDTKKLKQLENVWKWLMESGASRNSMLVNLGGGVISDIGGFAAATFNRGMRYINIPTSLVGQVDAGIGGKTGINVDGIKNQAGLFYNPIAVFILPQFLETLPQSHFRSGFAEIVKCAALSGKASWNRAKKFSLPGNDMLLTLIDETVNFKCSVVAGDPLDTSSRKVLNFGHTVGHSLESFYLGHGNKDYLHGDAVAAGMICEAYVSARLTGLPEEDLEEITSLVVSVFQPGGIESPDYEKIISLIEHDKKQTGAGICYSLLEEIGKPVTGILVNREILIESFNFYNTRVKR
jgi:3-dehydroquinate synthase